MSSCVNYNKVALQGRGFKPIIFGKDGVARLRRLHQIPCDRCVFFTGDYRLKCTVHPVKALTEDAINCTDYESTTAPATVYSKWCQQFGWSMPKTTTICDCSTRTGSVRILAINPSEK